ncbi:hypothetical protein AVEN_33593-1 [Araneus ventricosus]|uniref:Uncharacterized protein n=1 Tax=Araneus ventricosus TaxID=182803 RepID=A0A4Y2VK01_ARAVE|nr:hypothetical protein AVEN_33593-1 [Araneus ventricosus]
MDDWLENGSLKKTDVVSSNAEIAESKDAAILEPAMQSTSSSVQLQPHLPTLPSSNFGQVVSMKRRKYDTSYLSFGFTSTGNEEAPDASEICIASVIVILSTSEGQQFYSELWGFIPQYRLSFKVENDLHSSGFIIVFNQRRFEQAVFVDTRSLLYAAIEMF